LKLIVCGTGSSGNTYLLTNGMETLVLDAGVPFLEAKKALNFNIQSIKGVLPTHKHGDHHAFAHQYEAAGIPVWRAYEGAKHTSRSFGGFKVQAFDVVHNVPCVGYLIEHEDLGRMIYVTDTEYVKYRFKNLRTILIEANWSRDCVNREDAKYRHVLTGHMELNTCLETIKANATNKLCHVILCHLSRDNADPEAFREAAEEIVPPGCTVDVAKKGLTIDINEIPF